MIFVVFTFLTWNIFDFSTFFLHSRVFVFVSFILVCVGGERHLCALHTNYLFSLHEEFKWYLLMIKMWTIKIGISASIPFRDMPITDTDSPRPIVKKIISGYIWPQNLYRIKTYISKICIENNIFFTQYVWEKLIQLLIVLYWTIISE